MKNEVPSKKEKGPKGSDRGKGEKRKTDRVFTRKSKRRTANRNGGKVDKTHRWPKKRVNYFTNAKVDVHGHGKSKKQRGVSKTKEGKEGG